MSSVRLTVRVNPRSSTNEVAGYDATGALKVRVTAPPADGKANEAVIRLLADAFGVPKSAVTVVRGASARLKLVEIAGVAELGEAQFRSLPTSARPPGRKAGASRSSG